MSYRDRTSHRLQNWDYSKEGIYYVTFCTHERFHYFGKIENGKMLLSQIGELAMKLWQQIPEHFSNVQLAEFVIMPNHIHGLLTLLPDRACPVPTVGTNRYQNIGRKTLSAIVGSYKAAVSREAHRLDLTFVWQPRFYDRILRSRQEYINVAQYILDNPINWERDEFYE